MFSGLPNYEIAVDGSRFVMSHDVDHAYVASTQLDVVLSWFDELQRLVPQPVAASDQSLVSRPPADRTTVG